MKRKNEALYFFLIILLFATAFTAYFEFNNKRIQFISEHPLSKGLLDLSEVDFEQQLLSIIEGEAEFYWNQLISPADFEADSTLKPDGYIHIPGVWNSFMSEGKKIGGFGYATYRFTIKVKEDGLYGIRVQEFDSSYEMWANKKHVASAGKVGKTPLTSKPNWKRNEVLIESEDQEIEVIIHISNFVHRKGGAEDRMYFGLAENILTNKKRQVLIGSFLLGFLVMLSIYHAALYFFRRKDISLLLFSALAFFIALRLMSTGEKLMLDLFPDINWFLAIRIEYISYKMALPLMFAFFYSFYKELMSVRIVNIIYSLAVIFCLIVLVTPVRIFSYTPLIYQGFIALGAIYMLVVLIRATLLKKENAFIFLTGYILFFVIMVNDILFYNKLINTAFLMHFGLFVLAFSQSIVLSKKFSTAYTRIEELTWTLEEYNRELEKTIESRTIQIKSQKEEIEHQAEKLKIANSNLLEISAFKESITQMIIHDLKNPLNIVLNFSKDERVVFAGTQMLNLVHNLLDVQRYEKSKMALTLEYVSVNEMIKKAIYQMNYLIQEKSIKLETSLKSDLMIHADAEIINRVFINLLSNALKFTPNRGTITINSAVKNNKVKICFSDTGPGIPEDQKELVFQKFGQYMVNRMGKSGSTGIGLAFCKLAMEAHQGMIDFESKLGKGTVFCCYFPVSSINSKTEMNQNMTEYVDIKPISFTSEEKEVLAEIIVALESIEIYEISKIKYLISKINPNQSENLSLWVNRIRKAIINADQVLFTNLINMTKNTH